MLQDADDALERSVNARESSSDLYREYKKQRKILQVSYISVNYYRGAQIS